MAKIVSSTDADIPCRKRAVRGVKLFISENVMNDMIWHSEVGGENEIMGLLVGRTYSDDEGIYVTVEKAMTSSLLSNPVSVKFNSESMEELIDGLDGLADGETITGWYHSHPGLGCFLSETDIRTQQGVFGDDCGFAIVVDPVQQEVAAFEVSDGKEVTVQFVVTED